ncbi:plasmid mobilization protein [Mucilaginibacter terrae]|uniref:Plasmid mobilization relaxosome protein MobC n=1 Tax=Mucilaginibacter terrae TaxID=1955052 RepID=A0ABU3GWW0_9SPHI|nr:hypothetical protein [Mucilaginibacter terrae]MDT3404248.1 hypothetical protein [Mucilaginibacter terrae]
MGKTQENRSRWLKVRLKPSEYMEMESRFAKSSFQSLSEFGRAMLLGKPVTVLNRDRSMDDVLEELTQLRRELNSIGNNLNQAMRSINSAHGNADTRLWMGLITLTRTKLEPAITQIKERMNQYAELWLQRLKPERA